MIRCVVDFVVLFHQSYQCCRHFRNDMTIHWFSLELFYIYFFPSRNNENLVRSKNSWFKGSGVSFVLNTLCHFFERALARLKSRKWLTGERIERSGSLISPRAPFESMRSQIIKNPDSISFWLQTKWDSIQMYLLFHKTWLVVRVYEEGLLWLNEDHVKIHSL